MNKLFKLKKWLTIDDTAKHLTSIFDEPVKDYDILRFALDGHLKLSVNLVNHAHAKKLKIVSLENARTVKKDFDNGGIFFEFSKEFGLDGTPDYVLDLPYGDNQFLQIDGKIISVEGVMDLMMIGNEALDIEHEYQQLTSGIEVTLVCIEGAYLQNPENGDIYELQDHFKNDVKSMKDKNNYYPAGSLPKDSALVVRTKAISDFIDTVDNDKKTNKPLSIRTENNYLRLIFTLANSIKGFNPNKPYEAAQLIIDETGIENISREAIVNYISKAHELHSKEHG